MQGADRFREGDYRMAGVGISRAGAAWEADVNLRGRSGENEEPLRHNPCHGTRAQPRRRVERGGKRAPRTSEGCLPVRLPQGVDRLENGYSDVDARHNGSKEKIALSVGCDRRFAGGIVAGVSLKGFLMTEEAQTVPQFREERTSRGIALAFRIGMN